MNNDDYRTTIDQSKRFASCRVQTNTELLKNARKSWEVRNHRIAIDQSSTYSFPAVIQTLRQTTQQWGELITEPIEIKTEIIR